jgi:hypothetical protein
LVPWPVWKVTENVANTGIRYPYRPDRTYSLYRLRYPGVMLQRRAKAGFFFM